MEDNSICDNEAQEIIKADEEIVTKKDEVGEALKASNLCPGPPAVESAVVNTDEEKNNPYAYIDRNGFTSEKFKIEIRGLPKFYGIGVSWAFILTEVIFYRGRW